MTQSVEELRLLSSLLDEALDLPPAERETWLNSLQGPAAGLSTRLREMLERAGSLETDDLLARGPAFTAAGPDAWEAASGFGAGAAIGPYRLVRELGRGGMGEVWLAERVDGQLKREVALKLPMLGLRRGLLAERFARERDILAGLVHPHIARLYDAGVTQDGQPYMALEYVQGASLTAYCDQHRLGFRERLALVMQVLDAVQYAHTRLVIHRDLKPSNILVTEDGQVQLLDFGVAKLLAEEGAQSTQLTRIGGQAFTPDYASPEQVRGESLGTASDVYSLGVVLYELLSGQRPYRLKVSSPAQLEQAILEAEPQPPSAVATGEAATARDTPLKELQKGLRGDLDTIVLKALKKQPQERYGTVAELAEDLRRYRDGEPVLARPDSWGYRARKYVGRNRLIVASVASVTIALLVGLAASLWEAREARRERDRALESAERGEAMSDFMTDLIVSAASGGKPLSVKELLDRSNEMAAQEFKSDPLLRADVLMLLGRMHATLDGPMAGLPYMEQAEAATQGHGERDQITQIRCFRIVPDALTGRAKLADTKRLVENIVNDPATRPMLGATCLYQLASVQMQAGDPGSAVVTLRNSLALMDQAPRSSPKQRAQITGFLAATLGLAGRTVEAEPLFDTTLRQLADLHQDRGLNGAVLRHNWASIELLSGNARKALELESQNLTALAEDMPGQPMPAAMVQRQADAFRELGRLDQAAAGYRAAADLASRVHEDRVTALSEFSLAVTLSGLGRNSESDEAFRLAESVKSPSLASGHLGQLANELARAAIELNRGNWAAARDSASLAIVDPLANKAIRAQALTLRARSEVAMHDSPAALADATTALQLSRDLQGGLRYSTRTGNSLLVQALAKQLAGLPSDAQAACAESVEQLSNSVDPTHPALIEARALLGSLSSMR